MKNESAQARTNRLARQQQWYQKNKVQVLAAQKAKRQLDPEASRLKSLKQGREWRAANPGRTTQMTRAKRGIVNPPRETPSGPCQICGRPSTPLHCDHDKATGLVRGWLCNSCNLGLGKLGDTAESLRRALAYLEASASLSAPANDASVEPPEPSSGMPLPEWALPPKKSNE